MECALVSVFFLSSSSFSFSPSSQQQKKPFSWVIHAFGRVEVRLAFANRSSPFLRFVEIVAKKLSMGGPISIISHLSDDGQSIIDHFGQKAGNRWVKVGWCVCHLNETSFLRSCLTTCTESELNQAGIFHSLSVHRTTMSLRGMTKRDRQFSLLDT